MSDNLACFIISQLLVLDEHFNITYICFGF